MKPALQFGHYYVVDVSFNPNNPIHRAIATPIGRGPNHVFLFRLGYESETHPGAGGPAMLQNIQNLAHFEIISEIEQMHYKHDTNELPTNKKE